MVYSAISGQKTLIVPDKDADGLDAGVILQRTLQALGLEGDLIDVHLLSKHATVHDESERRTMEAKDPKFIIVVDQGSREAPPIVDSPTTKCLIIDHHLSDQFPRNATVSLRRTLFSMKYFLICTGGLCMRLSACCNILFVDL